MWGRPMEMSFWSSPACQTLLNALSKSRNTPNVQCPLFTEAHISVFSLRRGCTVECFGGNPAWPVGKMWLDSVKLVNRFVRIRSSNFPVEDKRDMSL